MENHFDICCGIDVGKWAHHVVAIDTRTGEVCTDRKINQSESEIRSLLGPLCDLGSVKIIVDQPGNMSALLFAVAKSMGIELGFITPKAMSQAIGMYGRYLKTDAHDALVIAEISANLPKLVKPVDEKSGDRHRLAVLMSYDRELTSEVTRACSRIHDLLLSISPPLEILLQGKRIQSKFYLLILQRYGGPEGLKKAGRGSVRRWIRAKKGLGVASLRKADAIFDALDRQNVIIPGTDDIEELVKREASCLYAALEARRVVAAKRDAILDAIPDAQILMSLPGTGAVTCATFIAEVGDITRFDNAARLASYAGLSPRVRQSGKTVHSTTKPCGGNRRLKRVLILSASKSILFSEESRTYYDRKRHEGRCYSSAITALARKRVDVMYAMLRDKRPYCKKNG